MRSRVGFQALGRPRQTLRRTLHDAQVASLLANVQGGRAASEIGTVVAVLFGSAE